VRILFASWGNVVCRWVVRLVVFAILSRISCGPVVWTVTFGAGLLLFLFLFLFVGIIFPVVGSILPMILRCVLHFLVCLFHVEVFW